MTWPVPAEIIYSFVMLGAVAACLIPQSKKVGRGRRCVPDPGPTRPPLSHVREIEMPYDWDADDD